MFWHGGFPLLVCAYALLRRADTPALVSLLRSPRRALLRGGGFCRCRLAGDADDIWRGQSSRHHDRQSLHVVAGTRCFHHMAAGAGGTRRSRPRPAGDETRPLAHDRHGLLAVRHRAQRLAECRPVRRRLLCRANLWSDRIELRARRHAARDKPALWPAGNDSRRASPACRPAGAARGRAHRRAGSCQRDAAQGDERAQAGAGAAVPGPEAAGRRPVDGRHRP